MVDRAKGDEVEVLRIELRSPTEEERRDLAQRARAAADGAAPVVRTIDDAVKALRARSARRSTEA